MRKPRDLFKKTGDIKGTFRARMDMKKNRNSKDLTKQRRLRGSKNIQNYTKKKVLITWITTMVWLLT